MERDIKKSMNISSHPEDATSILSEGHVTIKRSHADAERQSGEELQVA